MSEEDNNGLRGGTIAGIIFCLLFVVCCIVCLIRFILNGMNEGPVLVMGIGAFLMSIFFYTQINEKNFIEGIKKWK